MATLELESTLTDRFQTTVPDAVRRALKLGKRDKIRYLIQDDGSVRITRAVPASDDDPVLSQFLDFLADDIKARPEHIRALDADLAARLRELAGQTKIDLDAPLPDADE
jgi:antitoxin PrlF